MSSDVTPLSQWAEGGAASSCHSASSIRARSPDGTHPLALLQILRGLAAVMVVVHHFSLAVAEYHPGASILVRSGLGSLGAAGVDLFFVISGFIMVLTQSRAGDSLSAAATFWWKRFIRIFPLYWLWTSVLLALWAGSIALQAHHFTAGYIAFSYMLWPIAERAKLLHPLLDQGWTLSYEIYFYCLFGLSIALGLRRLRLPFLAAAFALLATVGRLNPTGPGLLAASPLIVEFLLGASAGVLVPRLRAWGDAHARLRLLLLSAGGAGLLGSIGVQTGVLPDPQRVIFWGVPAFVIVAGAAVFPPDAGRSWRRLISLGDASYSIYLTHAFVTLLVGTAIRRYVFLHSVPPDLIILAGAVATVWICALSYPLIELPLLARLRATIGFRRSVVQLAGAAPREGPAS